MKTFIVKSALFICLLLTLCYLLQYSIDTGLRKTDFRNFKEWNDIFNSRINGDLIISGSSRAWVHFSPQMLDSAFLLNSYNLGINGYRFLMQSYKWQVYLKYNKKPRYLIQSLDAFMFERQTGLHEKYQFLPYLHDETISKALNEYQKLTLAEKFIPLFKYNNQLPSVCVGLTTSLLNIEIASEKYKGFKAQDKKWDTSFDRYKAKYKDGVRLGIDSLSLIRFDQLLEHCKKNDIKVIFVYSPEYIGVQKLYKNKNEIMQLCQDFAKKYEVPLLDYSTDSLCLNTKYFYNSQHLNKEGVEIFNKHLIKDLGNFIEL